MKVMTSIFAAAATLTLLAPRVTADTPFNGLILHNDNTPAKKVRVYVDDKNRYALSDKNGRFGLTDVSADDTLTLELGRKRTIRIPVEGRKSIK